MFGCILFLSTEFPLEAIPQKGRRVKVDTDIEFLYRSTAAPKNEDNTNFNLEEAMDRIQQEEWEESQRRIDERQKKIVSKIEKEKAKVKKLALDAEILKAQIKEAERKDNELKAKEEARKKAKNVTGVHKVLGIPAPPPSTPKPVPTPRPANCYTASPSRRFAATSPA